MYAHHRDDIPVVVNKANIQTGESGLDLGTGTGWLTPEASRQTIGTVGVDISPDIWVILSP